MKLCSSVALVGFCGLAVATGNAIKRVDVEGLTSAIPTSAALGESDVWTTGDKITSVEYSSKITQTYLPSKGVWPNPYNLAESLTAPGPMWTDITVPYSTIYVFPTGSEGTKDCTKVIYQDVIVVEVVVIDISVTVVQGTTSYRPGSTKQTKPTYTPAPVKMARKEISVELRAETVGGKTVVKFIPDHVDAEIGDTILFKFFAAAHSATQSSFDTPCTPLKDGFDSGLVPNLNNTEGAQFTDEFLVTTKSPLWFHCKQPNKNHCGQGMVFGVNPGDKMDKFIENAKKQNGALVDQPVSSGAPSSSTTTATTLPTSAIASSAAPAGPTQTVIVEGGINKTTGENTLRFNPPFLARVEKGSHIFFDFRKLNHTLTESTFDEPCKKRMPNAIDTNFEQFNPDDKPLARVADFLVDTDSSVERWFYCKQANGRDNGHCLNGMLFAINTDEARFLEFKKKAAGTPVTITRKRANKFEA